MKLVDSKTTFAEAFTTLTKLFDFLTPKACPENFTLEGDLNICPQIQELFLWRDHPFGDFDISFREPTQRNLYFQNSGLLLQIYSAAQNNMMHSDSENAKFLRLNLRSAHLNTERKKNGFIMGPDTTLRVRNKLLSVDYYFNQDRVARRIGHNGVPLEEFPDKNCVTACPATISLLGFLEDNVENDLPHHTLDEYFLMMPSFW